MVTFLVMLIVSLIIVPFNSVSVSPAFAVSIASFKEAYLAPVVLFSTTSSAATITIPPTVKVPPVTVVDMEVTLAGFVIVTEPLLTFSRVAPAIAYSALPLLEQRLGAFNEPPFTFTAICV